MPSERAAASPAGWAEPNPAFEYLRHLAVIIGLETRKMLKDPTEILSRSVQPALWLLLFGKAFEQVRDLSQPGQDYLAFLAPGILGQSIAFVSIFNGLAIIWERDMGLMQKVLATPIRRSALVLGKMLASSVRSLSQLVVILALALALGIRFRWDLVRAVWMLLLLVLGSASFTGLSMLIAAIVKTRERMMGIGQLTTMPLFFASSALYPTAIMPAWLQAFSAWNPMSYLVDGLRDCLLNPSLSALGLDVAVLAGFTSLMLVLGTWRYPRLLY
jgi:ABC-2 type transport system permease protein